MLSRIPAIAIACVLFGATLANTRPAFGIASTDQVAETGKPVTKEAAAQYEWPAGTLELINDAARTTGWHPWFSECPNDGNQYLYDVKNMGDVNRLIRKLAAVQTVKKQIILSLGSEPRSIPFGQQFPKGNGAGAVFLVGSQKILEEWFQRLPGGKFGVHHYEKAPDAQPPTLKLYVSNPAIDLKSLKVPLSFVVEWGYEPTPEHAATLKSKGIPIDKYPDAYPAELLPVKAAVEKFIAAHQARIMTAASVDGPDSKWLLCAMKTWKKYVDSKRMESEYIPYSCWDDEIRKLDPLYVYQHRVNIVVVLKRDGDKEEGLYISNPLSSFSGTDGFVLLPASEKNCSRFVRNRSADAGNNR